MSRGYYELCFRSSTGILDDAAPSYRCRKHEDKRDSVRSAESFPERTANSTLLDRGHSIVALSKLLSAQRSPCGSGSDGAEVRLKGRETLRRKFAQGQLPAPARAPPARLISLELRVTFLLPRIVKAASCSFSPFFEENCHRFSASPDRELRILKNQNRLRNLYCIRFFCF